VLPTPVDFLQDGRLVGGQVHDTVADDDIKRLGLDPRILETLDVACDSNFSTLTQFTGGCNPTFDELHVRFRIAQSFCAVTHCMFPSHLQLFGRHVYASDGALFTNQGSSGITITPRSTSKVKDSETLDTQRKRSPTTIEFFPHFCRDIFDDLLHDWMRPP
jgi:hypothetical protein